MSLELITSPLPDVLDILGTPGMNVFYCKGLGWCTVCWFLMTRIPAHVWKVRKEKSKG